MTQMAPGKHPRDGITLPELARMFPDDAAARAWFERVRWSEGRTCPHCGGTRTTEVPDECPAPFHCPDCRSYFSVLTGTVMAHTKMGLSRWACGLYLMSSSMKDVGTIRLHRDLGINPKSALMMARKINQAWQAHTA